MNKLFREKSTGSREAEERLLLFCASVRTGAGDDAALADLAARVTDWRWVVDTAAAHGVLPFVALQVRRMARGIVPEAVGRALTARFHASTARSLMLVGELAGLARVWAERGVAIRIFKGPHLAQALYGSLAMRQFTDLDVFVAPRQVRAARQVLLETGYSPYFGLEGAALDKLLAHWHVDVFTRKWSSVELHWDFGSPRFSFSASRAADRGPGTSVELGGVSFESFSTPYLLIHLCIHGCKHGWTRLGWLADIAQLIASERDLDWDGALAMAREMGAKRMLLVGTLLAHQALRAPVPDRVLESAERERVAAMLARVAQRRLFSAGASWYWHSFFMAAMDRTRDRLEHAANVVVRPTPAEWGLGPIPLRPVTLARRAIGHFAARPPTPVCSSIHG